MPRRVKTTRTDFAAEPYKNRDEANSVTEGQREIQLPFIFGIPGKPSLRHAPTRGKA
tara:strand:- start:487 stop:657 length:171 start_codon:yes stop_codon:yes gene_type:complete